MKRLTAAAIAAVFLFPGKASACVTSQGQHVMPTSFWDQVAICESSKDGYTADWHDGGKYSGGLGIYIGTWIRYGGRDFAKHAGLATKEQQIIVANRISVLGYQRKNGTLKQPVGFNGWGCIRKRNSLNPSKWKKKAKEQPCRKWKSQEVIYHPSRHPSSTSSIMY